MTLCHIVYTKPSTNCTEHTDIIRIKHSLITSTMQEEKDY